MENEMILIGREAIAYAEENNELLNKYADPIEDAREGLTVREAKEVASEDPRLIWVMGNSSNITFEAELGIKEEAIIVARCGSASALWIVGDESYSADDTDECPVTEDGCWPAPPADVIAKAEALAV